jgi:hypothetical protein
MSRAEIAITIWASIQLLFISAFGLIMFRIYKLARKLNAIDRVLNNRTFILIYMADMISIFGEEWGADAPSLRAKLLPLVEDFRRKVAKLKPSDIGSA